MSIKHNIKRRMLMVVASAMTVAVLAAGPAHADTLSSSFSVKNSGNYASQVVPAMQFANTGNFNNAPSFVQFHSKAGDYKAGGINVSFAPEMAVNGSHVVQQSSAASR